MIPLLTTSIIILAPATSANLGPGFDSLGLALRLYNTFIVEKGGESPQLPSIEVQGT